MRSFVLISSFDFWSFAFTELMKYIIETDLVYFTTRVLDMGDTNATRMTQVQHECNTSNTSATQVRQKQRECNTSVTRVIHKRHECDANQNFDFDNGASNMIFSYPFFSIQQIKGRKISLFHSKNYLLEIPCSHAKMRLKSAPQKLNFIMAKAILKRYTLD